MKTPQPGEPFYWNGFPYVITEVTPIRDEAGAPLQLVRFERPAPADEAEARAHRLNWNYRKSGKTADPLIWCEPEDLAEALAAQAFRVEHGSPVPGLRLWARGALSVQREQLPKRGAWMLDGCVLVRPPVRTLKEGEQVVLPDSVERAAELAAMVLDHTFYTGGAAVAPTAPQEG